MVSVHQVVAAVEKVGVGGVVLICLCLCVLVCERHRERKREQEIARVYVKRGCQGKCFVLWEFSSGCQAPVLEWWGDV